jgi:hypothetical protein
MCQGDGTAAICAGNPGIFTLSVHAANNFPARKQQSSLDVPLPDGLGDEDYLKAVAEVCGLVHFVGGGGGNTWLRERDKEGYSEGMRVAVYKLCMRATKQPGRPLSDCLGDQNNQ